MRGARQQALAVAAPFGLPVAGAARGVLTVGIIAACLAVIGYSWTSGDQDRLIVRSVVYGGWLASVVMHELAHGLVGYFGGDRDIKDRGYLTLNPLKFMDPVWSVAVPLIFLMLGGLPLMGGRTFIHPQSLRSRWWDTAVSLAGPLTNLALAIGIGFVFSVGLVDPATPLGGGLALLGLLQVVAAMFNLIPLPPLDGFGVLEPHMPAETARRFRNLGCYGGYFLVLALFWVVPGFGALLWDEAWELSWKLDIPSWAAEWGRDMARF